MRRLLHLRQSLGLYGADRALLDLAGATALPWQPLVGSIVRPKRPDPLGDEARRRQLPVWVVPSQGRLDLAAVSALARRLADEQISLLHAHDYKSLCLGALAAARAGIPVVATWHGDTGATASLRAYEALARVVGNATRGVAAVSGSLAARLRRWMPAVQVSHIPNGIHPPPPVTRLEREAARAALQLGEEREVVAVVGRLSVEKGHALLFAALRRLQRPPIVLVAGEGPLEGALREKAQGLEVRWLGFVADTRPLYAACDLVVIPSRTEGLPLVALEAMAQGRCLLATCVGELPVLLSGGAGLLVPPGDEAALADALRRALGSPGLREVTAKLASLRVRREYGLARMTTRYQDLLWRPALAGARAQVSVGREGWAR